MKDCVSFETARKLQDAGIDFGQTAFVWVQTLMDGWELRLSTEAKNKPVPYNIIPTTTTNEMLEWLPAEIRIKGKCYILVLTKEKKLLEPDNFMACYTHYWEGKIIHILGNCQRELPQEALAQLCLWVNKEGYK